MPDTVVSGRQQLRTLAMAGFRCPPDTSEWKPTACGAIPFLLS